MAPKSSISIKQQPRRTFHNQSISVNVIDQSPEHPESISLAALEIVVHLPEEVLLNNLYVRIPVEFDSTLAITLKPSQLPSDWNLIPPPESTQKIGSDWAKAKQSLVLKVPSSVIPAEHNYLINPQHPDAKRLKIGKTETFDFDTRIKY